MSGQIKRLFERIFGTRGPGAPPGLGHGNQDGRDGIMVELANSGAVLRADSLDGHAPAPTAMLPQSADPTYADQRVAEITRLFESREWQLQLRPVEDGADGRWEATFFPIAVGATTSTVVYAPTRLDAAETAWWRYQREPWIRAT